MSKTNNFIESGSMRNEQVIKMIRKICAQCEQNADECELTAVRRVQTLLVDKFRKEFDDMFLKNLQSEV